MNTPEITDLIDEPLTDRDAADALDAAGIDPHEYVYDDTRGLGGALAAAGIAATFGLLALLSPLGTVSLIALALGAVAALVAARLLTRGEAER